MLPQITEEIKEQAALAKAYLSKRVGDDVLNSLLESVKKAYAGKAEEAPGRSGLASPQVRYSLQYTDVRELDEVIHDLDDKRSLRRAMNVLDRSRDKTFVEKLLEHAEEKKLSGVALYTAAQIDKRVYSRMLHNPDYQPSRDTCLALAYALKLDYEEAADLLSRAGYSFSDSSRRDIILEYLFRSGHHDLFLVNGVLYQLNEKTLVESRF